MKVRLRDFTKSRNQHITIKYTRFSDSTTDLSTQIQVLTIAQTFEGISVRLCMSNDEKEKQMHMLASIIRKEFFFRQTVHPVLSEATYEEDCSKRYCLDNWRMPSSILGNMETAGRKW